MGFIPQSTLLLIISIFPSYVYIDCVYAYYPNMSEEGIASPETGVTDDFEPQYGAGN